MPNQNRNKKLIVLYEVTRGSEGREKFRWMSFRGKEGRKTVSRRYSGNL